MIEKYHLPVVEQHIDTFLCPLDQRSSPAGCRPRVRSSVAVCHPIVGVRLNVIILVEWFCLKCQLTLNHVICCKPTGAPLLVTIQRNSAEPPICTLRMFGVISTCNGVATVNLSSALASPPALEAEHL